MTLDLRTLSGSHSFSVSETGHLAYLISSGERRRLTWFDRKGQFLSAVGEHTISSNVVLSPDETRIADRYPDAQGTGTSGLWTRHAERLPGFNFSPLLDSQPTWSPDGKSIAWSCSDGRKLRHLPEIGERCQPGGRRCSAAVFPKFVNDWSPDGRHLLYNEIGSDTLSDLWVLPLAATENHFRTLNRSMTKEMAHSHPMVGGSRTSPMSPGNTSCGCNRSRQGQGKWQISADVHGALGVAQQVPRWRRDGRELYYLSGDGKVMRVEVKVGDTFQPGTPQGVIRRPQGPRRTSTRPPTAGSSCYRFPTNIHQISLSTWC